MKKHTLWIGLLTVLSLSLAGCLTQQPRPLSNRPTKVPAPPTATPTPRPTRTPKPTVAPVTASSAGAQAWTSAACHLCHGNQAEGGIGPTLIHTRLAPATFVDDVRNAAPPMPRFTAAEVDDVALMAIYGWLQNPQVAGPAPAPTSNASLSRGAQLWHSKDCAVCHGTFGQGGEGPQLAGTELGFEAFLQRIRQGSDQMPAHSANLVTDEELNRIYEWLIHDAGREGGC